MTITVILCTYNRCEGLPVTLTSLAASSLPPSVDWEVLVVDNNSNDRTREVVEDFCRRYPRRFRYLFEPRPGKSFALNSGVREAQGDILAFTDDDVTVDRLWLQNLTMELEDGHWAGSGGRTLPAHAYTPPPWLSLQGPNSLAATLYAHFDEGDLPRELDSAPYGANMAVRKSMFERYGGFRTDLGPSPDRDIPRPNEDTEFGRRLLAAGQRLRYEPFAYVYHPVPVNRVRKEYFLTWNFDYGRASVREWGLGPCYFGVPRRFLTLLKMLMVSLPRRTFSWLVNFDPPVRFRRKCRVWFAAGIILEICRLLRTAGLPRKEKTLQKTC